MSRFFGEIRQVGYVVPDIEAAMHHWSNVLGVGPWFYAPKVPVEKFFYKGQASSPVTSVALANSGPLQVELIQQRNDAPTMYRDFVLAGRSGAQHVAYWTESFEADLKRLTAQGLKIGMQGEVGRNGRYVYFETEFHPGTVVELSEVAGPKGILFRKIREASQGWDGKDPIRPFPDLSTLVG
ncbi:VOC family protein [Telmatospirillum sp.]|uniref:VOC family protein n=1 Tax=Telmatospirillum sp. TaxID=2079197 RepID=UPI002849D085|nr:VOC family protein [Telmatospirillum sp.]MDR3438384.1 VOC family protein [Telmatospirillum sp.]